MSYILDALRRADSERERGAVPSIHSPPTPPVIDDPKPARGQPQAVLVGVIVVLLLALAGLLAWHLMGRKEAPTPAMPDNPAPVTSAAAPTVAAPEPAPSPVVEPPARDPAPTHMSPPMRAPQAWPQQPPARQPSPSLGAAQPVVTVPTRPTPAASTSTAVPPAAVSANPPEADTRLYTVNDLPPNIQRELPKLVVGGAMYSEVPSNRMLIINSQVFHEGDKLSADLQLQEIKLKSAVFKYKGFRYGVSY